MRKAFLSLPNLKWILAVVMLAQSSAAVAKPESWYWGFQMGGGSLQFRGANAVAMDRLDADAAQDGTTLGAIIFVYWPIGPETLLGASEFFLVKAYTPTEEATSDSSMFMQGGLLLSVLHSFGSEYGRGVFLKGEIGLGISVANITDPVTDFITLRTSRGLLINGGVGYGFAINTSTALLVSLETGFMPGSAGAFQYMLSGGFLF
jgi:hypothetical protein